MANTWINPIILDTQNDDNAYSSANDAKIISTGVKYTTDRICIDKIICKGANTNQIQLKQCSASTLEGQDFLNITLETGRLVQNFDFPNGFWVNGIIPKVITSGAYVYIYKR